VRELKKLLRLTRPKVVLTRHKLSDGYSDDVMVAIGAPQIPVATAVIVLLDAGTSSGQEARQVALGAESVQRDPVRSDVLAEYLAKYLARWKPAGAGVARSGQEHTFHFAGVTVRPIERRLERAGKIVPLTPREVQLAEILFESQGEVVPYTSLYAEVLSTSFRGDTSNMRVLLGKLGASIGLLGVSLRQWVEVIPKTGYRYHGVPRDGARVG